jgi:hypothetical protein
MLKLKEGQKVIGKNGKTYLIEKGDFIIKEKLNIEDDLGSLILDRMVDEIEKVTRGRLLAATGDNSVVIQVGEMYDDPEMGIEEKTLRRELNKILNKKFGVVVDEIYINPINPSDVFEPNVEFYYAFEVDFK